MSNMGQSVKFKKNELRLKAFSTVFDENQNEEVEAPLNTWEQLPFKQKMLLVDYWTLVIILSNLFHIMGMCIVISPDS
jgi:hypothetical protein